MTWEPERDRGKSPKEVWTPFHMNRPGLTSPPPEVPHSFLSDLGTEDRREPSRTEGGILLDNFVKTSDTIGGGSLREDPVDGWSW